ncbi:MAG: hypothetical protein ACXW18_05665 [Pyrinomonadaceae bacterium]
MRRLILLAALFAAVLVPGWGVSSNALVATPQTPTFSSSYTALTKCGSGMTKKEEREAEKNGQDIPTVCKGPDGYAVDISYSACSSNFSITKGDDSIGLGMQAIDWKQKAVEFRLANGKPFAVIMRSYEYAGSDVCATSGKITGESLVIKGLKGYEHIDETVDAKTPNANVKARELADKGFEKPRS